MNNNPVISIIIPVYNVEKYLSQCLDSILEQTFTDFEVLLIDDGSLDRSGDICDKYAEKDGRIRTYHQQNAGVSSARNVGLYYAKGTYITFIDSDDYVTPDYLKNLSDMLPIDSSSQGMVVGGFSKLLPDGSTQIVHVPELNIFPSDYYRVLTELLEQNIKYTCSKLYDNRLIQKWNIQFIPSISCFEDMFFMLDYLLYSNFLFIRDNSDYIYRVGYSLNSLSTYSSDFRSEYAAFVNYLDRVYFYKKKYALNQRELNKVWRSLTAFFHRVILAIYKVENRYTRKDRLCFLRELLSSNKKWIKNYFSPQYKVDIIGKFLLSYVGVTAFDGWMRFLLCMKFKRMFGSE